MDGVGTNEVTFNAGNPSGNRFRIEGVSSFSTLDNVPFNVGTLTYRNGATFLVPQFLTLPVDVTLDFTEPAGLPDTTFSVSFELETTPNQTGDPVLDGDILEVSGFTSSQTVTVGANEYVLTLLGFSTDGGTTIISEFELPEFQTVSADLFATIEVTPLAPVGVEDSYTTAEDTVLVVPGVAGSSILDNDFDNQGDSLTAALDTLPSHGNLLAFAADGSFTYSPDPNFYGTDTFTYFANDGAFNSLSTLVTIDVAPRNDPPSFVAGGDQVVGEDAGAQTVAWATGISAGPANEAGQSVTFNMSNDNSGLFSVQPAIAPDGTLTYTPAPNANGSAMVTVTLTDDGGTANGGADTSAPQTFVITVNSVVDALIDVKPGNGGEVDPINLGAKGVTPIAILATQQSAGEPDDFDPTALDLALMSFRINGESIIAKKLTLEDVDGDGDLDLLLHFATADLAEILTADDTQLALTAEFGGAAAGSDLAGSDAIRIVPKKGKK